MALFEIGKTLVPFKQLQGTAQLYESEVEDLLWENLDALTGEVLFPIARQARIPTGGIPDIIALGADGRVVIIEVKRDVERSQLAQTLEYAGWALKTNLQEIAKLYPKGTQAFFSAWQSFTNTSTPILLQPPPRLIMVAREFEEKTDSALDFLMANGVPVHLLRVAIYEDSSGRRFVDVEAEARPPTVQAPAAGVLRSSQSIRLVDLLDAKLIVPGETLTWKRPKVGEIHKVVVTDRGLLRAPSGKEFNSPSLAADAASGNSHNGWTCWRRKDGRSLADLRDEFQAVRGRV